MWLLVSRLYAKAWLRGLANYRDLMSALGAVLLAVAGLVNWQSFKAISQNVGSQEVALSVVLMWFSIVGIMSCVVILLLLIFAQLDNSADSYLATLPLKEFDLRLGQLAPMVVAMVVAAIVTSLGALLALQQAARMEWWAVVLMVGGVVLQTLAGSMLGLTAYRLTVWGLARMLRISETLGSILGVVIVLGFLAGVFLTGQSFFLVPGLPGFWIWRVLTGASPVASFAGLTVCSLCPLVVGYYVLKGVRVRWRQVEIDKVGITWATPLPNQASVHAAVFVLAFLRYPQIGRQLLASSVLGFILIGGAVTYLIQHLNPEVQGYALDSLRSFCWLVAGVNGGLVALTMSNMDQPFRWFYNSSPINETSLAVGRFSFFVTVAVVTGLTWMGLLEGSLPVSFMTSGLDWAILTLILVFKAMLGYVTGRVIGYDFDTKTQMTGVGVYLTVAVLAFFGLVALGEALTRLLSTAKAAFVVAGTLSLLGAVGAALWVDRRAVMRA